AHAQMREAFEAREDAAVFLGEVHERAEDAFRRARDDAAVPPGLLGDPGAARDGAEFPHEPDALVPVERHERRLGAHAPWALPHEVRPFPLPSFVFDQELAGGLGVLAGHVDERAGELAPVGFPGPSPWSYWRCRWGRGRGIDRTLK